MPITLQNVRNRWEDIRLRIATRGLFGLAVMQQLDGAVLSTTELDPLPQDRGRIVSVLNIVLPTRKAYDWLSEHDGEQMLHWAICCEFACPWDGPIEFMHRAATEPAPLAVREAVGILADLKF